MKSLFRWTALLIVVVGFLVTGCRRVPPPIKPIVNGPVSGPKGPADPFRAFLDNTRYPDNPRPGDDWTRFRDNFDQITPHFAKPEVRGTMRLDAADRTFLEKDVHLTDAELAEIDSSSFRTPDAHYLDECFLLHDAARTLEVRDLSPAQQADMDFQWVVRNVMLHEQGDTWLPAAFTVRRGYGSAVERALVFLALLRQARMEGCLIVVPDSAPLQFLVGALDSKAEDIVLFDARLGQALPGKDRKRVLTLKEALADPALLQPARIAPDQAKKLEAWLVCPLYALAPRMLELQNQLSLRFELIALHLNAKSLRDQVAAVTPLPVKVWNPPAQGKAPPNSPTRCLSLFLPKEEGGLDPMKRAEFWAHSRIPSQNIEANLAQINVTKELLPTTVFGTFHGVADLFFAKYDLQVRELYLRGQYETIIRRQERLQAFARDDTLIGLAQDATFRKEVGEWEKVVRGAFAAMEDPNPQIREKAQMLIQEIAWPDEFMKWMLEGAVPVHAEHIDPRDIWIKHLDKERPLERDEQKERKKITLMSKIQAVGMRDYFAHELARSQALTSHEKAGRAQANVDAAAKPTKAVLSRSHDSWTVARNSWFFYLDRIPLSDTIDQRLAQVRVRLRADPLESFDMRLHLLESLHLDVHKYFQAKLNLAECKSHLEDTKKVAAYLADSKKEIEDLQKKGLLQAEIKALGESVQQMRPPFRTFYENRLELLAHDWTANGPWAWMLRAIDARTAALP
jgi:hypothetical protein